MRARAWCFRRHEREKSGDGISSVAALRGSGGGPYAAMKAALHGWVYDLAAEVGPHGGTANVVAPGFVPDTEFSAGRLTAESRQRRAAQTLVGREGTPDEIASLITWLLGPDRGWVTGQIISPMAGSFSAGDVGLCDACAGPWRKVPVDQREEPAQVERLHEVLGRTGREHVHRELRVGVSADDDHGDLRYGRFEAQHPEHIAAARVGQPVIQDDQPWRLFDGRPHSFAGVSGNPQPDVGAALEQGFDQPDGTGVVFDVQG
jgi:hypothetical protein